MLGEEIEIEEDAAGVWDKETSARAAQEMMLTRGEAVGSRKIE